MRSLPVPAAKMKTSAPVPPFNTSSPQAAIDGLLAGTTADDVVVRVADGIAPVAGDDEVFDILGQPVAHPRFDGIDATAGLFRSPVDAGIEVVDVVAEPAKHRDVHAAVTPQGIVFGAAKKLRAGVRRREMIYRGTAVREKCAIGVGNSTNGSLLLLSYVLPTTG